MVYRGSFPQEEEAGILVRVLYHPVCCTLDSQSPEKCPSPATAKEIPSSASGCAGSAALRKGSGSESNLINTSL